MAAAAAAVGDDGEATGSSCCPEVSQSVANVPAVVMKITSYELIFTSAS